MSQALDFYLCRNRIHDLLYPFFEWAIACKILGVSRTPDRSPPLGKFGGSTLALGKSPGGEYRLKNLLHARGVRGGSKMGQKFPIINLIRFCGRINSENEEEVKRWEN